MVLNLKEDKLHDFEKEEEAETCHELQVLRMDGDFWDRLCGLCQEI